MEGDRRGGTALGGQLLERAEGPVVVLLRLRVGEEPGRVVSGVPAEGHRSLGVAPLLAVAGDLGGDPRRLGAPVVPEAPRDLAVQLDPAGGHEVLAQHRKVEPMGEGVPRGQRAVGQRLLAGIDDQVAHAAESPQVLFDLPFLAPDEVGDHGAQELAAADARHLENVPLRRGEPVHLVPHEILEALGGLQVQLPDRPGERPPLVSLADVLPLHEDVHEAPDEERQPLGARVERGREGGREAVPREAPLEVRTDVLLGERAEGEIPGRAARQQVEGAALQGGVSRVHVSLAERPHDERPLPGETAAHVVQELDAGGVRPLQVLHEEDDRERPAGRLHEVARFPDEPLLGGPRRPAVQRAVGVGQETGRQLHADGGREGAQEARGRRRGPGS